MSHFCPLCEPVADVPLPMALIAIIRGYVHSPITIADHKHALDAPWFFIMCTTRETGELAIWSGVSAIEKNARSRQGTYLSIIRIASGKHRDHLRIYAVVYRSQAAMMYDAHAFDDETVPYVRQLTTLRSPYITDEFLDDLLAQHPNAADVASAVATLRGLIASYYEKVLYGPAHGLVSS